ncbi:MAG: leucine-rich repeat domain-containing protein, partial [Candidatus Azobacteroides sp.]|nr:leucine-rich repeat domain-containing protein [Candidatus Azobacteroides sp.]
MKKIVFLIIFNLSLLSVNISAQTVTASGTTGPLIWSLNSAGTLTISGNGAMPDYSPGGLPWYNYQSNIKTVILSNGVTSIGNYAFYSCSNLTSITIPNSVRSIGSYAFYYCPNLTSISIPSGVTSIGSYAFFYCSNLTSITIPSSVTNIGSYGVFYYCSNLTSINVASDNVNYSSENGVLFNKNKTILIAFPRGKNGIYTIPNSVTSIGSDAFGYCSNLTSITIPSSVTNISSYAFQYCFNLKTITVNWSVPFTVNSFVFSGLNTYSITLYVPSGTKSAYQTNSVWGNFNIVESAAASYMITASAGSGGTISPSGSVSFTYGSSRTFYFYSNTGYEINQVLVDGVNNASAVANGYYTFSNVTANHTISVSFRQRQYTITASAGSGGSISPSGSVSFTYGSSRTFYFYPNTGYEINQVLVDGVNNVSAVSYGY